MVIFPARPGPRRGTSSKHRTRHRYFLEYHFARDGEELPAFEVTCPCCNAVLKDRPGRQGRHRSHRRRQAKNLQRHGRSGSRHERARQSPRLHLSPIRRSPEKRRRPAGKEIPGSRPQSQGIPRHRQTHPRLRPRLTVESVARAPSPANCLEYSKPQESVILSAREAPAERSREPR